MYQSNSKNQKGVSLIIAILILGVVMVISLAISVLMTRELKMATNIDWSVTSYFAAESGVESALWEIRKEEKEPDQLTSNGFVLGGLPGGGEWNLDPFPPEEISVDITKLYKDRPVQVKLDKDTDSVEFSGLSLDEKILVSLIAWPTGNFDPANIEKIEKQIMPGYEVFDSDTFSSLKCNVLAPNECELILRLKAIDINSGEDYLSLSDPYIKAEDEFGGELSIKSNQLRIISIGSYQGTKRSLQAVVYKQPPLHGIFDYVLFSDESIIK